jgi:S-adenosylmethionine uptake transporter
MISSVLYSDDFANGRTQDEALLKGAGIALIAFAFFSTHDALVKSLVGVHPFQIAFFVFLFSFLPFSVILAVDPVERSLRPKRPLLVGLRCLFTAGSIISAFYAFSVLPMAQVYAMLFATPVLITLLSIPLLGERVRVVRWIAILFGLVGVMIVLNPTTTSLSIGHVAALFAAVLGACNSINTRKIGDSEHSVTLILYPMIGNVLVSAGLVYFVYQPMPGSALVICAAVGLLSVAGHLLLIRAFRTTEAQFVGPMQYSQIIWASIYGVLFFNEPVKSSTVLGSLVIIFSGVLFIWRELTASVNRPVLRTRNVRMSGGPPLPPVETDDQPGTALKRKEQP